MQNAPDLTLSPSEKRTLQRLAANDGFDASELDWVALQRLKKLGLAEDRAAGVRITKEGQRVLRRSTRTLPAGMASKRTISLVMRGQLSAGDLATADQATQEPGGARERVDVNGSDERCGAALDRWRVPTPSLARHQPAEADHLTSAAPTDWGRAAKLPRNTHLAHPIGAEGAERNGLLLREARGPSGGAPVRPGSGCRVVPGANRRLRWRGRERYASDVRLRAKRV